MDISQIIVTISGIALIGLTLWVFFGGGLRLHKKIPALSMPARCTRG